jgi:hypothetical protein
MAAKKKATKTKTKKKKTAAGRTVRVSYKCDGGCTPSKNPLKIKYGDTVIMKAIGTDVHILFRGRSPFRRKKFDILAGKTDSAEVIKKNIETFRYSLSCDSCPGGAIPPQMIID